MKISILTATYNRENYLEKLYNSILKNSNSKIDIEWLIMDDGSTDKTKEKIKVFISNNKNITIKYYYQNNQGKMSALNNLIPYVNSDLILECDSDDYLTDNALEIIYNSYIQIKDKKNIYALVFLKNNQDFLNIGTTFKYNNYRSNMFNIYFKDNITGDKALVFFTNIRKNYNYKLEKNEKFSTEARLHNELDKTFDVICFNSPILICNYLNDGYSKNINKIFKENPYGYYEYFTQLLTFDYKNINNKKRLYAIKHLILFSYLSKQKIQLNKITNFSNILLIILLYIPGIIKSKLFLKNN